MALKRGAIAVALVLLAGGCKTKFGTVNDPVTGMSITNTGLSYGDALVNAGDSRLTSDEVALGSKIVLVYTDVKGFERHGGRLFPGASMTVIEQGGETIGEFRDLFDNYTSDGMDPENASKLSITLTTGRPMAKGKSYTWKVRVWDKKGSGEIVSEMKIKIK
ncbi:MAG: hypothetical protein JW807_15290 [Spirochaetes bacterium]|nr:hypothetical protein [Spirochaetota bacterium]